MSTADILPFFDGQWIIFQKNTLNRFYFWQTLYFCWRVLPCLLWSRITISSLPFSRKFPFWFLSKTLLSTLDFRCDRDWGIRWNIDWQVDINFTNHLRLSETKSLSSFYRSKWNFKNLPFSRHKIGFSCRLLQNGFQTNWKCTFTVIKSCTWKRWRSGKTFLLNYHRFLLFCNWNLPCDVIRNFSWYSTETVPLCNIGFRCQQESFIEWNSLPDFWYIILYRT